MKKFYVYYISFVVLSCTVNTKMPNLSVSSYKDDKALLLEELINERQMVIWMPMSGCGVCIHNIIDVVRNYPVNNSCTIITTDVNPAHYNWLKLNIRQIEGKWEFYYVNQNNSNYHKYILSNDKIKVFILNTELNCEEIFKLNSNKKSIYKILKYLYEKLYVVK